MKEINIDNKKNMEELKKQKEKETTEVVKEFINSQKDLSVKLNLEKVEKDLVKLVGEAEWRGAEPWIFKFEQANQARSQALQTVQDQVTAKLNNAEVHKLQFVYILKQSHNILKSSKPDNVKIEEVVSLIEKCTSVKDITEADMIQIAKIIGKANG